MRPRIALAGGGSGGHLYPGLALARAILPDGDRPLLYGSRRRGEAEWVGEEAERVVLDSPVLPGRSLELPRFLLCLARALCGSLKEMRCRRPDLVVGLGGYASVAPGVAAILTRRPLLLLEQNVVPGKANRLLARLGGRLAASFPESLSCLDRRARRRARVVGNPVRRAIREGRRSPGRFGLSGDRPILLVVGGSQGAAGLNRCVTESASRIAARGVEVLHLAGLGADAGVRERLRAAGVRAFVAPFSPEMGTLYATADLVLSRAGGTTLAELTVAARPSVLVPYPHHGDRHQERNAAVLARAGAARVIPEEELTPERFEAGVLDLLASPRELGAMAAAAADLSIPDAADRAADWAKELMEGVA